jgi:hypothetical protein
MRPRTFYLAFFASPVIPVAIYAIRFNTLANVYFLSIALGLAAFTYLCNQLILASNPDFAVKAVGEKKLESLHISMPVIILILAAVHRILKLGSFSFAATGSMPSGFLASFFHAIQFGLGFSGETSQAALGAAGWWLILVFALVTATMVARSGLARFRAVRRLRAAAEARGFGQARARMAHLLGVVVAVLLVAHVLTASSSGFQTNVAGAAWLLAYPAGCIAFYAFEKLRSGSHAGPAASALGRRLRDRLKPRKGAAAS